MNNNSIFSSLTKKDIKVGYIDPSSGYVENITICDANDYAQNNPGTRFIFKDGDGNTQILNINGVNALTPSDLLPKKSCSGLQTPKKCDNPPAIEISGGGGLGAKANAVIGSDGSLIAIDVIDGGFGYITPPVVKIVDPCNIGSGAVATAIIDDIINTTQLYELEPEYYEICKSDPVSYGKVYGSAGEDLGEWDSKMYFNNVSTATTENSSPILMESVCPSNPIWTTESPGAKESWRRINKPTWSSFTNSYAISPTKTTQNTYKNSWTFIAPYRGYYGVKGTATKSGKVFIDTIEVATLNKLEEKNPTLYKVFLEKGEHKIDIELYDTKEFSTDILAISAIIIPPPCPQKVKGKKVVTKIIIQYPGNGYQTSKDNTTTNGYPIILELKDVTISSTGINYDPNKDKIKIVPDNGAELSFKTGPFGVITEVNVVKSGIGFTSYPYIYIETNTGINFSALPVFDVIRNPELLSTPTQNILQITDLVGLKQTGYVNGKPYFGSVYYENGVRYAGVYKTPGTPIQIYDTLQESIAGKITTRPSAIKKSGSDIRSNNPILNIPGTIQ